MKTKLFILLLFSMALVSMASGQRLEAPAGYQSLYFDREDFVSFISGDTTVYLYEKGNRFEPGHRELGNFVPGFREFSKSALSLFQKEFTELEYPKGLLDFRGIMLAVWIDDDGNAISFYYSMPNDKLNIYPDLEKHLYAYATSIKKEGFKKYDMRSGMPGTYCCLYYHFNMLYRSFLENRPKNERQP